MRPQRAGEAESPAEMQRGKWTVEGEGKGREPDYPRRRACVMGGGCVGIPEKAGRFPARRSSKVVPQIFQNLSFTG
ncbi:hypothetical protein CE91St46_25480 [Eubacteriales bacterium]|nr:hypothetical protein CE91St46_25480 [Eubacteriales bacterium]GKH64156.1 hypothetical protein CE91St47_26250 [Eubacteriales bacterium]